VGVACYNGPFTITSVTANTFTSPPQGLDLPTAGQPLPLP